MRPPSASREFFGSDFSLRRRDFLLWGSACALTSWWGTDAVEAAVIQQGARPLPIGFVEGSERFRTFRRNAWRRALRGLSAGGIGDPGASEPARMVSLPARSLSLGDQNLAGESVRLAIHGLYPGLPGLATVRAADLDVLFPSPDPLFPAPLRFHAWSYRPNNSSPPLSFVVPLGLDGQLDLELTVYTAKSSRRYEASFTVDWDDQRPKLQRGVYLLGLTSAWDSVVNLPRPGEKVRADLLAIAASVRSWAAATRCAAPAVSRSARAVRCGWRTNRS